MVVDMADRLGDNLIVGPKAKLLSYVPGNEFLQLVIEEKQIALPRLPAELDGFSIAHLSDIHSTGCLHIEFFHEVVKQTNNLRPDLVLIAGDIIDNIELLSWIPETLGNLSATLGVYFILGNHDQFTHQPRIRQAPPRQD